MPGIHLIDNERAAAALADLLNGDRRTKPVVVVTVPAGRDEPWADPEEVAREAGPLADVYLMPTGPFSWEFSRRMAEGTQVYGGAARVYPVGHAWASDLSQSPLHFAFDAKDGERVTDLLISDALRMATAAGLTQSAPTSARRKTRGVVRGLIARRAFVDVGNALPAAIAEELVVEGVPIERILTPGQVVDGWYDAETNRVDVSESLRRADDALSAYAAGDVVLTRVAMVRNGKAELILYPRTSTPAVVVAVLRADVTTNPLDDLRTLMTVGEVIPARVTSTGPDWALVLNDVDDDEVVIEAPALLPGGPPWLVEEPAEPEAPAAAPLVLPMPAAVPAAPTREDVPAPTESPAEPATTAPAPPPRPTPTLLDRNRPRPADTPAAPVPVAPPAPAAGLAPTETTKSLLLKIEGLKAEVGALTRANEAANLQHQADADERAQLKYLLDQELRRANRAEHDLKAARARLRKAGNAKPQLTAAEGPRFGDPELGFRYLVTTQWATRTLPGEQADRPMKSYTFGPAFFDSLARLEGIPEPKVADVVFEIVTGLAPHVPGREVHRMRSGSGGDDPVRVREDGATAWRASLQVRTPSARRIHYWILPSGEVEFARVSTHDDFDL